MTGDCKHKNVVDIEAVLEKVNRFGVYHVLQFIFALLPVLFVSMSNANYVFAAKAVPYRCTIPQCENGTWPVTPAAWWSNVTDPRCTRPTLSDNCTATSGPDATEPCDTWIYQSHNSIVSEFGLACEEWKRTLVGTVHNIGVLISMPLLGYVSDRWGRRTAIICSAVGLMTGALKTLPAGDTGGGYTLYVLLELLEASIAAAVYTSTFVIMVELGGKERRVLSTAMLGFTITLGEVCLTVITWLVPHWRHFLLVVYCPCILFLSYVLLMKESIRWLLINGKMERAKRTLMQAARMNKLTISEHVLAALDEGSVVCDKDATAPVEEFSIGLLFSSVILLKRLVICSWWWFSAAFVYYGLMINSVTLPGNQNLNFGLAALVAVPGDLASVLLLDRYGRKTVMTLAFAFCGLCCVANGFIPLSWPGAGLAAFLLGKAAVSLCFSGVYVYTSELFPTSARSSLLGVCSMFARVGSIIAPLTPLLTEVWWSLPTVMFGCSALTAALLGLLTPETLNQPLPDTVAQAERIGTKRNTQNKMDDTTVMAACD